MPPQAPVNYDDIFEEVTRAGPAPGSPVNYDDIFEEVTRAGRVPGASTIGEQLAAKQAADLKRRQQEALREWHEDKPRYFKKLLTNVPDDVGRQLIGIVGLGVDAITATGELGSDLGNFTRDMVGLTPYYLKERPGQEALKRTLESLPDALIAHYSGYLDPEGLALKVQEGPVTTALDVIPAAGAVKGAAKAGTAAARAAGRVVTAPGLAGRLAKGAITHVPGAGPYLRNVIDAVEAFRGAPEAPPAVPRPPTPTPVPGIFKRQPAVAPVDDFGVAPRVGDPAAPPGWTPDEVSLSTQTPEYVAKALAEAEAQAGLALTPEQRLIAKTLMVKYGAAPEMAVQAALGKAAPETMPASTLVAPPAKVPATPEALPASAVGAVPPVAPAAAPVGDVAQRADVLPDGATLTRTWAERTPGQQSPAWLRSDLGLAARRAGLPLTPAQLAEAAEGVRAGGLTPEQAVEQFRQPPGSGGAPAPVPGAVDLLLGPKVAPSRPAAPVAEALAPEKPKLTLDEFREVERLRAAGKTDAQIEAAIEAMRALSPMTPGGLRTETAARVETAARRSAARRAPRVEAEAAPAAEATPAANPTAGLADTLDTPWAARTRGQQSPAWLENDLGLAARRAGVTLAVAQRAAARELVRTGGLTPVEAVRQVASGASSKAPDDRRPRMRASTMTEQFRDKIQDLYGAAARQPLGRLADALGVSDLAGIERSFSDPEPQVSMGMPGPPGAALGHLAVAPVERVGGRLLVSTRVPSAKGAPAAAGGALVTNLEAVRQDPALMKKFADRLRTDPMLTARERRLSDAGVLRAIVDKSGENINALIGMVPKPIRTRAAQWYPGGHQIANEFAKVTGVTGDQAAAVLASQSPSKEWHQNVDLGRRIMSMWKEWRASDPVLTSEMAQQHQRTTLQSAEEWIKTNHLTGDAAAEARARAAQKIADTNAHVGIPWNDLPLSQQARMMRAGSELADPAQAYPIWSPEGTIAIPAALNKDGTPKRLVWQSYANVENALSVLQDGSDLNISQRVGNGHKVRSFFNNINVPQDLRSVTVDTHNVGGAHVRPMGGNAPEVKFVMGGPGSAATGIKGAHALYRDAVVQAAKAQNLRPSGAQSISWEAIKGLFSPAQRRNPAFVKQVEKLWREHSRGKMRLEDLYDRITDLAGGVKPPEWFTPE